MKSDKEKIDENIQELISWSTEYPKAKVSLAKCPIDILEEYAQSKDELQILVEQFKKMQKYYDYVRTRNSQGKLSRERYETCKEGNVRGVFGYPTKIEKLAKRNRIEPDKIDYILNKYGSMENFVKAYKENRESGFEAEGPLKGRIRFNISIDTKSGTKDEIANQLYRMVFGFDNENSSEKDIIFFDGEKLKNALKDLTDDKTYNIVSFLFGINDGKKHTLEETRKRFQMSREKIRQTGIKTIRKLRQSLNAPNYGIVKISQHNTEKCDYTPEEEKRKNLLLDRIFESNFIFVPDEEYDNEPDSMQVSEIMEIAHELASIQIQGIQRKNKVPNGFNLLEEANDFENARLEREKLAREIEKLKKQIQAAERVLESYDRLLENDKNSNVKGE